MWVPRFRPYNKAEVVSVKESISTPRRSKAGPVQSNVKSTLIAFVSIFTELCHHQVVQAGRTTDQQQHNDTQRRLRVYARRKRPAHHTYFSQTPDGLKGKDI